MPARSEFVTCEVLTWLRGGTIDDVAFFTPQAEDLNKSSPAKALALEICEVDLAVASWAEVCFVQFLSVCATDCHGAITAAPQIPPLAGAGSQRRGSSTRVGPLQDGGITHSIAPPRPPPHPSPHASAARIFDVFSGRPQNKLQKLLSQHHVLGPVEEL